MPLTTDWLAAIARFILEYLLFPHLTQRSLNKSMTKACLTAALLDCPFSVMPNAYVWIKRSSQDVRNLQDRLRVYHGYRLHNRAAAIEINKGLRWWSQQHYR